MNRRAAPKVHGTAVRSTEVFLLNRRAAPKVHGAAVRSTEAT